jgi:hypothetical protein
VLTEFDNENLLTYAEHTSDEDTTSFSALTACKASAQSYRARVIKIPVRVAKDPKGENRQSRNGK